MTSPRLTAVTVGVRDLARSVAFYEALGFERKVRATGDEIAFYDAGGVVLVLWHADKLAEDAALMEGAGTEFRRTTMGWNCKDRVQVDEAFVRAKAAGAKVLREPSTTDYGGYRAYFADPDGHVWEIVVAPGFEFTADGRLVLPD